MSIFFKYFNLCIGSATIEGSRVFPDDKSMIWTRNTKHFRCIYSHEEHKLWMVYRMHRDHAEMTKQIATTIRMCIRRVNAMQHLIIAFSGQS